MYLDQPKTILITGGAGFIGANFIHHLAQTTPVTKVINLDLLTYAGKKENLKHLPNLQYYSFVEGDICDKTLVESLLKKYKIDTIVHFAAESHVDRSIKSPEMFVKTNIVGTFTLLEAAREYWLEQQQWDQTKCRFHHISTDEVYGTLADEEPAFTEQTQYAPNSPYSASKAASDHLVRSYFHTYGLPVTTSNCSNNYGPYQDSEKLIPKVIQACLRAEVIPIYGDGKQIRDWLYVEDHCKAIEAILHRGIIGETYNVGGNSELKNIDVVHFICDLIDEMNIVKHACRELITFVKDRPGHDKRYAINIDKIKDKLAWTPKMDFAKGIQQTINHYLSRVA